MQLLLSMVGTGGRPARGSAVDQQEVISDLDQGSGHGDGERKKRMDLSYVLEAESTGLAGRLGVRVRGERKEKRGDFYYNSEN
jgi:hypothetical protein